MQVRIWGSTAPAPTPCSYLRVSMARCVRQHPTPSAPKTLVVRPSLYRKGLSTISLTTNDSASLHDRHRARDGRPGHAQHNYGDRVEPQRRNPRRCQYEAPLFGHGALQTPAEYITSMHAGDISLTASAAHIPELGAHLGTTIYPSTPSIPSIPPSLDPATTTLQPRHR